MVMWSPSGSGPKVSMRWTARMAAVSSVGEPLRVCDLDVGDGAVAVDVEGDGDALALEVRGSSSWVK